MAGADVPTSVWSELVLEGDCSSLSCPCVRDPPKVLTGEDAHVALLPPGARLRSDAYSTIHAADGTKDTFLADLEQWPAAHNSSGQLWPTQMTHGLIYSWQAGRPAISLEHLGAQGFHLFPSSTEDFTTPLLPIFNGLSCKHIKDLSGNGMHLAAFSSWVLYVLSNVIRVHDIMVFSRICTCELLSDPEDEVQDEEGIGAARAP